MHQCTEQETNASNDERDVKTRRHIPNGTHDLKAVRMDLKGSDEEILPVVQSVM